MGTALTYGGWVQERPVPTGGSNNVIRLVGGCVGAAAAALSALGTGGELSVEQLLRTAQLELHGASSFEILEANPIRSPGEDLARIREILNPAVSDLATTFGVSRQSVYNWLNGEAVAPENAAKLQDLAQAADVLAHEGIARNSGLLKRKLPNGKTLMQIAQAGESARDAALALARIHKREAAQRERMNARFANRAKTPATADFDLPSPSDPA